MDSNNFNAISVRSVGRGVDGTGADSGLPGDPRSVGWTWLLVGQLAPDDKVRSVPINASPFRIGRRYEAALRIAERTVSGFHAELIDQGDTLLLRDLGSTNGTYLNGQRVRETAVVAPNDFLQFANVPFRVRRQVSGGIRLTIQSDTCDQALSLVQFDRLLSDRAVIPHYQPIVALDGARVFGYELLARSNLPGLESALAMFRAASLLEQEAELSRVVRWEGVHLCAALPRPPLVFVNTHPRELVEPGLLESLQSLRASCPTQPLTLEIHEAAITDATRMHQLRGELRGLNIGLAFDDFGAGQSRLIELAEVQPDYLKFDIGMIRDIHRASLPRQQLLEKLVQIVTGLGVVPLAEGVECAEEAAVCLQMGFCLAQGFFFGRPAPIRSIEESPGAK